MSVALSSTVGWSQTFVNYLSQTIGTNNEPAITNANNIKQIFLSVDVGPWSWNRSTISFQTVAGQQDYTEPILSASVPIFGWLETATVQPSATITNVAGSGTIATITAANAFAAGNLVTTTGLTNTVFNVANATIITATATQFTFASTHSLSSTADSGLAVSGQLFQLKDVKNTDPLSESTDQQRPSAISVQSDDGAGNIKFRFMGVPNAQYNAILNFQQASQPFTTTSSTWSPIPDRYAYIYNRGFLAETLEPVDAQRSLAEKQRFVMSLVSIAEGMELADKAIFIAQYLNIDAQTAANMLGVQQSGQAKAQR
jgi:hypothetical protein